MKLLAFIAVLLLASCGPAWHLSRANYHLRMAKAKGALVQVDTVYDSIPVVTREVVHDTLVVRRNLTDTLIIKHTKYQVKLKYDTITKREFVQVDCKPDTIMIRVPVKVVTKIEDPKTKTLVVAGVLGWFLLILLIVYLIRKHGG